MKQLTRHLLFFLAMCASVVLAADVNMTLKNTEPLVDTDGATKLVGSSTTTGDLVQLIDLGVNGQIDLPNADGTPGGDDSLVSAGNNPTSVGVGQIPEDTGKLNQINMIFDDSLELDPVYVRFWNGPTAAASTHYGNSAVTNLPEADGLGFAELDFAPTSSHPHTTDKALAEVPTLTEWGFICLVILLVWFGLRQIEMPEPVRVR